MILEAAALARGRSAIVAAMRARICNEQSTERRRPRRNLQSDSCHPFHPRYAHHEVKTPEMPDQVSLSSRNSLRVKKGCSSERTDVVDVDERVRERRRKVWKCRILISHALA